MFAFSLLKGSKLFGGGGFGHAGFGDAKGSRSDLQRQLRRHRHDRDAKITQIYEGTS